MSNLTSAQLLQVQSNPDISLATTAGKMFQAMSAACLRETGHPLEIFEWGGYRDDVLTNAMADHPAKFAVAPGVHLAHHPNGSHEDGNHVDIRFSKNSNSIVGKWLRGGGGSRFGFHPDTIAGDPSHWAFVATSVAGLLSSKILIGKKRSMYLIGEDQTGVGYLVTDNGRTNLTGQEYSLFYRLVNADQARNPLAVTDEWPEVFNATEISLVGNALARANNSAPAATVDTVAITDAVTQAVKQAIAASGVDVDADTITAASEAATNDVLTRQLPPTPIVGSRLRPL